LGNRQKESVVFSEDDFANILTNYLLELFIIGLAIKVSGWVVGALRWESFTEGLGFDSWRGRLFPLFGLGRGSVA